jgi:hypothetical protein
MFSVPYRDLKIKILGGSIMSKQRTRVYCDECERPTGFDNVVLYHGFNAFCSYRPCDESFTTLMNNPQIQLCTSTKYLGMMGVTVTGTVLMASSYDLCSCIDKDTNRRWFDERDIEYLVSDYSELEHHWDDNEENNEIILTDVKITGIWVTSDANNTTRDTAIRLSKEYNLPIIEVGESIFN